MLKHSGYTFIQLITVAGAAMDFHHLPCFIIIKHHNKVTLILESSQITVKRSIIKVAALGESI